MRSYVTGVRGRWLEWLLGAGLVTAVGCGLGDASIDEEVGGEESKLATSFYISDIIPSFSANGWGPVELDMSNGELAAGDGRALTLDGKRYGKGLGVHAASEVRYPLKKLCSSFEASLGVDDEVGQLGSVVFEVWGDGRRLYQSRLMTGSSRTRSVKLSVSGVVELSLVVLEGGDGNNYDHADWANARLLCSGKPGGGGTVVPDSGTLGDAGTDAGAGQDGGGPFDAGGEQDAGFAVDSGAEPDAGGPPPTSTRSLSDLPQLYRTNGWGPIEKDMSSGGFGGGDGQALSLDGQTYVKGLGAHAPSDVRFSLGGVCSTFGAKVGVDDEVGTLGSIVFQVFGDDTLLFQSPVLTGASATLAVQVDLLGYSVLRLVVTDSGDNNGWDHADWADATVTCGPSPAPPANAWRLLGLIVRNTDVTFTDPATGLSTRVVAQMTAAEEAGAVEVLQGVAPLVHLWSGGLGSAAMDIVSVNDTVHSVSRVTADSFWVSPTDVKSILDPLAPPGRYDSILFIWDPDDGAGGVVPVCCGWAYPSGKVGLANGATWATFPTWSEGEWGGPFPAEGFVHEWLHGSAGYYRSQRGLNVPDPHENNTYGFPTPDSTGSWSAWYTGLLSGTLWNPSLGKYVGFTPDVWALPR